MFRLTELTPVTRFKEYYIAYADFLFGATLKISFVVSTREDLDDIHYLKKRATDGKWALIGSGRYSDLNRLPEISIGMLPNLKTKACELSLKDGVLTIKDLRSPGLGLYNLNNAKPRKSIYVLNDLEMGLFNASRERAQKKLKTLKEIANV